MFCISCDEFSFSIICETCQDTLLRPNLFRREIEEGFFVYSFYSLEELEDLLNSKYYFHGDRVFNILAKLSFSKFAREFSYTQEVLAIPIDDHTRHEFSHTAILAHNMKSSYIKPIYNKLKANNKIKYAGKDLDFRLKNPRKFTLKNIQNETIILLDDVITTGTTLKEARKVCLKNNNDILFALTLADAKI